MWGGGREEGGEGGREIEREEKGEKVKCFEPLDSIAIKSLGLSFVLQSKILQRKETREKREKE